MEDSVMPPPELSANQIRWETVVRHRVEIAEELGRMADEIPGPARPHLRSLKRWFEGSAKFEVAVKRPDVLAIGLSVLASSDRVGPSMDSQELCRAVRFGFLDSSSGLAGGRRLIRLMLYPFLILLASLVLVIVFSCTIAPQFQEMFAEFGIELPRLTLIVLGVCDFVQDWWQAIVLFPILLGVGMYLLNYIGAEVRPGNLNWIEKHLMSTRNACASWIWHVSLLLDFGLSQNAAVSAASEASGNPWLKQIGQYATPANPSEVVPMEPQLFLNPRFHLASQTMKLAQSKGKIALMREVATYYWDRNQNVGDWWIQWLNAFILWSVGLAIVISIVSLFLPLIAIVSGLTGGRLF